MTYCVMCQKKLVRNQLLYCGKNCSSAAYRFRSGKTAKLRDFEPTAINSFFHDESVRRLARKRGLAS